MQTKSQLRFSHPGQTKTVAGMGKLRPPRTYPFTTSPRLLPKWKWKSLSCVQLCNPYNCSPWNSPGQNTGVGSLSLLQEIFPTQGWNLGLPHYRWILYQLSHKGSPRILEWVASLLQRIFPTQESNQGLLNCRWILYQLSYEGCPRLLPRQRQKAQKIIPCVTRVQNWWKVEGIPELWEEKPTPCLTEVTR